MAQIEKVEGQVEVNCNADKFFDVWALNSPQVSKICPDKFPHIELIEGQNCHSPGAILLWTFVTPVDGKHEYVKTKIVEFDEKNRSFYDIVIEGDIMNKYYKSWKEKIQVIPKGENCCIVKWNVIECEKKCEDAPNPKLYVDFILDSVKHVARHISSSA